jgi:hypothetical protein
MVWGLNNFGLRTYIANCNSSYTIYTIKLLIKKNIYNKATYCRRYLWKSDSGGVVKGFSFEIYEMCVS